MQRPMSDVYKIDGEPIPEPSGAPVEIIPLEGPATGRTRDGLMHTEIVHLGKRKVSLSYDYISQEQLSDILVAINKQYFTFTFLDPEKNVIVIECYKPPTKSTLYHGVLYGGLWRDVTISMIER